MNMPLRLAVIGDPVAHSASPELHRAFLAAARLEGTYEPIVVRAGGAARAIEELRAAGYGGLNVTTPLKEEAFARAETRDAAAAAAGAVNTLLLRTRIEGYNTDGIGALTALTDAGLSGIAGSRILVLGGGATARTSVAALNAANAAVFLWSRTPEQSERIACELGGRPWHARLRVDAVFAALAPGATLHDPKLMAILQAAPIVVDANYGSRATLGTALGRSDVHDGRAMLRSSSRASFSLFQTLAPGACVDDVHLMRRPDRGEVCRDI